MRRKLILPVTLVLVLILSMLSPFVIHKIQDSFNNNGSEVIDSFSYKNVKLNKNDYIYFGNYLNKPILWKVLDIEDKKALLMSEYVISFKAFDACGKSELFHQSDSEKYGSSTWENSTLKEWLNSDEKYVSYSHCPPEKKSVFNSHNAYAEECGFLYKDNFNIQEKKLISADGVFILNNSQMKKYFDNKSRRKICTPDSIEQNDSPYIIMPAKSVWYWTSSPVSSNNVSVSAVTSSGAFYKSLAFDGAMGVCPALYIETVAFEAYCGDGSKENPYIMTIAVR